MEKFKPMENDGQLNINFKEEKKGIPEESKTVPVEENKNIFTKEKMDDLYKKDPDEPYWQR